MVTGASTEGLRRSRHPDEHDLQTHRHCAHVPQRASRRRGSAGERRAPWTDLHQYAFTFVHVVHDHCVGSDVVRVHTASKVDSREHGSDVTPKAIEDSVQKIGLGTRYYSSLRATA